MSGRLPLLSGGEFVSILCWAHYHVCLLQHFSLVILTSIHIIQHQASLDGT